MCSNWCSGWLHGSQESLILKRRVKVMITFVVELIAKHVLMALGEDLVMNIIKRELSHWL